jgi:hypothetical protein
MPPERPLKIAVVILCTMDAGLWLAYAGSVVMALVWAAIAIGFVFWIARDIKNE